MESVTRITEEGEDGNIDSAEEESTHSDAEAADVRPFPRRSNRLTQQSRLDSDSSSSPEPSVAEGTQKLFKDLTFYYIPKCSNNPDLKMLIEFLYQENEQSRWQKDGGGTLTSKLLPGAIRLTEKRDDAAGYVHIDFILDSVKENQLKPINPYRINSKKKTKSLTQIVTKGRAHYTPEEDDAIVDYVERHKKENCVKGNKIWKDMEAEKVTIHSWQSMKCRYLKNLQRHGASFQHNPLTVATYKGKTIPFVQATSNATNVTRRKAHNKMIMASSDSSEDEDFAAIKKRRKTESPYVEKSDAVASGEKSRRLVSEESVEEFIEEDDQTEIDPVRKDSTEVGSDTDNEKNPDNVSKLSLSEQDSFDEELFGLALSPEYKQSQQEKALGTRFKALTRNMTPDSKDDEESLVSSSQEVVDQLKHIQEESSVSSSQEQNDRKLYHSEKRSAAEQYERLREIVTEGMDKRIIRSIKLQMVIKMKCTSFFDENLLKDFMFHFQREYNDVTRILFFVNGSIEDAEQVFKTGKMKNSAYPWTPEEDQILQSTDERKIKELIEKRGEDNVEERILFLES